MPCASRSSRGYGSAKPNPHWPGDARVAVSFVVNFEEGGEYAMSDGDDHN
ncbi:MAG: chitin deacetylase, partial [Roseiarcus sp.]